MAPRLDFDQDRKYTIPLYKWVLRPSECYRNKAPAESTVVKLARLLAKPATSDAQAQQQADRIITLFYYWPKLSFAVAERVRMETLAARDAASRIERNKRRRLSRKQPEGSQEVDQA